MTNLAPFLVGKKFQKVPKSGKNIAWTSKSPSPKRQIRAVRMGRPIRQLGGLANSSFITASTNRHITAMVARWKVEPVWGRRSQN